MNRLLIVILAICSVPLHAQGAQPDAANLKAEARNAVGTIGADKHKTQTYCQILDLARPGEQKKKKKKKKQKKRKKTKKRKRKRKKKRRRVMRDQKKKIKCRNKAGRYSSR